MHSWARMVSSLLVLLGSSFLSFKMGCTWKSLLWEFFSHNCCHFFVTICLIFGLRSVYGIFDFLSSIILRAALANESALCRSFMIPYLQVVSYAFSRSKNIATRCCFCIIASCMEVSNLTT